LTYTPTHNILTKDEDALATENNTTMTTPTMAADNPFVDPNPSSEGDASHGNSFATASTLAVGKNASLTLGTDSLIVLGRVT
jgi:hypothetical protein